MRKKWIIGIIAGVLVLLLGYGGYSAYEITHPKKLFQPVMKADKAEVKAPEEPQPKETAEAQPEPKEEIPKFDENKVNILLLGLDKNKAREKKYEVFRSDTMILASIDFEKKKVQLISIPRDSYVKIAGRGGKDKINSCLYYGGGIKDGGGGFKVAMDTVSQLFGNIPIQYYVGIDMELVINLVDDMGGIWYDVDVPVNVANVRYIKPGYQKLTGLQVLDYSRHRNTPNGDIDRIQRQQKMMMAVFDQMKSIHQLKNLPVIYNNFSTHIYTNLGFKQMAALGYFARDLSSDDFIMHKVEGFFLNIDGISYWGIDQRKRKEMVKDIFGIDIPLVPNDRQQPKVEPKPAPKQETKPAKTPEGGTTPKEGTAPTTTDPKENPTTPPAKETNPPASTTPTTDSKN